MPAIRIKRCPYCGGGPIGLGRYSCGSYKSGGRYLRTTFCAEIEELKNENKTLKRRLYERNRPFEYARDRRKQLQELRHTVTEEARPKKEDG